jgi:DNA-binding NarL/FixJ family response regulator
MKKPTLVLADDDNSVLEIICRIVKPYFDVVSTANDGIAVCKAVARFNPSAVVLDVAMPVMTGIQAAKEIIRRGYGGKLLFLSVYRDQSLLEDGLAAGASGYVLKDFADTELITAIRETLAGRIYLSSGLRQHARGTRRSSLC